MTELLFDWVLQPLSLALLAWAGSLLIDLRGTGAGGDSRRARCRGYRRRIGPLLGAAGLLGLWVSSTPAFANALTVWLEADTSRLSCAADGNLPLAIPGADMNAWARTDDPYRLLGAQSIARTLEGAALAGPVASLYLLGGGDNGRSLAGLMGQLLRDRGIEPSRLIEEPLSRSTRANAQAMSELLAPPADLRLVTSALHLPRARRAFEAQGYRVCGIALESAASPAVGVAAFLPWLSALQRSSEAVRELQARLLYTLAGHG